MKAPGKQTKFGIAALHPARHQPHLSGFPPPVIHLYDEQLFILCFELATMQFGYKNCCADNEIGRGK
jgi:hypothetical protein